jgi:hypothetical protein
LILDRQNILSTLSSLGFSISDSTNPHFMIFTKSNSILSVDVSLSRDGLYFFVDDNSKSLIYNYQYYIPATKHKKLSTISNAVEKRFLDFDLHHNF